MQHQRHSTSERLSLTTSSAQILPPVAERRALLFSPHPSVDYYVRPSPLATTADGILVTRTCGPVLIRCEDFGDIVCHRWYAVAAAAIDVSVLCSFAAVSPTGEVA